jgi:L-asparaginase
MSRKRVLVMSLGGTIAMTERDGRGAATELDADDLVRAIPELAAQADITTRAFRRAPGAHLDLGDVEALAHEITAATKHDFDGVVVTQGTDTIEEVAFALDLLLDGRAPVVVTGAMRTASQPGADGPANLLDAVVTAASDEVRALGTVVVFGGEVHAARYVRKRHTVNQGAFESVAGPLGWIVERRLQVLVKPAAKAYLELLPDGISAMPRVALMTTPLGEDGSLVPLTKDLGYDGLVVEAMGAGHVPVSMATQLKELAKVRPVVLCSRTGSGPVLRTTYGFAGSERDLLDHGLISGGYLDGPKARVALMLLLRAGADQARIRNLFHESFGALL